MTLAARNAIVDAPHSAENRWRARLALHFARDNERTVLARREHCGPLRVQRPFYPEGPQTCHVYVLHPPGGLVGGDELDIRIAADRETRTLLTTPAAGKFYRSAGPVARQHQTLHVGADACMEWLPQENIVYDGANAVVHTRVVLEPQAHFIGWDMVCLGRPAANEQFTRGEWRSHFELWRGDKPLLIERTAVDGASPTLTAAWGWGGASVTATLVATGRHDDALDLLRADAEALLQHGGCGVTQLDDIVVARYLGHDADEARRILQTWWATLRPRALGSAPCRPRIWET